MTVQTTTETPAPAEHVFTYLPIANLIRRPDGRYVLELDWSGSFHAYRVGHDMVVPEGEVDQADAEVTATVAAADEALDAFVKESCSRPFILGRERRSKGDFTIDLNGECTTTFLRQLELLVKQGMCVELDGDRLVELVRVVHRSNIAVDGLGLTDADIGDDDAVLLCNEWNHEAQDYVTPVQIPVREPDGTIAITHVRVI